MKLLGVRQARSIWLVPQYFLNPKGIFLRAAAIEAKERYQFLKSPFENGTAGTTEAKYENGGFKSKRGNTIQVSSMILHPDGVVADTMSSTEDTDAFLEDIFGWLHKSYGLGSPAEVPITRLYVSELNITMEKQPAFLNPKLQSFCDEISSAMGDEKKGPAGFLGFQLSTDPEKSPRPSIFRFEREISTSITGNRYYSSAPIQTTAHIKLLEKLEKSL